MDLEQTAIERLKFAAETSLATYGLPLIVTTSGGKDSDLCVELALRAGIEFEAMHNHTTADAPESVYHIRDQFKRLEEKGIKCTINMPTYKGKRISMWTLIPLKLMPPTRVARYCCEVLKEGGGAGRMITTGVRWAESNARKKRGAYEVIERDISKKITLNNDNDDRRRWIERCQIQAKTVVNPIIEWQDRDVWDYIQAEHIEMNPLYQCGFHRVGCIGCPMASKMRYLGFSRYPTYERAYIRSFDKMIAERKGRDLPTQWETGTDVMHWWMEDGVIPGQIGVDDWRSYEKTNLRIL